MLELRSVTKVVGGVEHIRDVSLTLAHGSLNVLLGPTLAGKTLADAPDGRARPADQRLASWLDGVDVTGMSVRKRRLLAMVYQQFINYPDAHRLRQYRLAAAPTGRGRR